MIGWRGVMGRWGGGAVGWACTVIREHVAVAVVLGIVLRIRNRFEAYVLRSGTAQAHCTFGRCGD